MTAELTVRPAHPSDTTALSAFATRTFREAFAHTAPPDAMATYLHESFHEARVASELNDPDTLFLLATDRSGVFAGYVKLYFRGGPPSPNTGGAGGDAEERRTSEERHTGDSPVNLLAPPVLGDGGPPGTYLVKLWRLYTAQEWQGRGGGTLLLEHAAKMARERGGTTLWLTVNNENTGAVRFYERNGFRQIGFTDFNLGGVIHRDFVMEKVLGVGL